MRDGKIQTQGVAIPRLGFGTFRMPGGGCQPVVESALGLGFRHIDTAAMYENDAVGAAIASSGVKRARAFLLAPRKDQRYVKPPFAPDWTA